MLLSVYPSFFSLVGMAASSDPFSWTLLSVIPCLLFLWRQSLDLYLNLNSHPEKSHGYGDLFVWILMCSFKYWFWAKSLPQKLQTKRLNPMWWTIRCLLRHSLLVNFFSQSTIMHMNESDSFFPTTIYWRREFRRRSYYPVSLSLVPYNWSST